MKDIQTDDVVYWSGRVWRVTAVKLGTLETESVVELVALDRSGGGELSVPIDLIPPPSIYRAVHPQPLRPPRPAAPRDTGKHIA